MPLPLRLLVAIANYGTKNDQYLARLIAEYRSMPFAVDIVVLTNAPKEVEGVEVRVGLPTPNPWSLPFGHQQIFADRRNEYDLFLYSEDDVLITQRNIEAFLEVQKVLPGGEIAGFLRYEEGDGGQRNYPDIHGSFHWDVSSVCQRGPHTLAFFTNEHAACYILTRDQLSSAIESGGYLVKAHEGRYDLLCSAATDPYTQCGFRKLICISHFDDFLLHHLPNKYVGTRFGLGDPELRRQIESLLQIGTNGSRPTTLFETETKLKRGEYSKDYYESANPEVVAAIPEGARSVLSVGCGWGSTESQLSHSGMQVSAVPLDPVIPGGALAAHVQIVDGDLTSARQGLANRRFDCLLLSNILHLVPQPLETLSSYLSLLSDGGAAIAVSPNTARLTVVWKKLRGDAAFSTVGNFEKSGVHRVSQRRLRSLFRTAGMKVVKFEKVFHQRPTSRVQDVVIRFLAGMLGSWMADEFVVVARRPSDEKAG